MLGGSVAAPSQRSWLARHRLLRSLTWDIPAEIARFWICGSSGPDALFEKSDHKTFCLASVLTVSASELICRKLFLDWTPIPGSSHVWGPTMQEIRKELLDKAAVVEVTIWNQAFRPLCCLNASHTWMHAGGYVSIRPHSMKTQVAWHSQLLLCCNVQKLFLYVSGRRQWAKDLEVACSFTLSRAWKGCSNIPVWKAKIPGLQ